MSGPIKKIFSILSGFHSSRIYEEPRVLGTEEDGGEQKHPWSA